MEKNKNFQTLKSIDIRKLKSVEEMDKAMMMRFNELKSQPYYKNLEQFYDTELEAGRNMFNNGIAWGAFNENGEVLALFLAFDLTFEPYTTSKKLLRATEKLKRMREHSRKFLNSKPGEYCYVGYAVARRDYRRINLLTKIGLLLKDDLLQNYGFKGAVAISVSREGFLGSRNYGFKALKYFGPWGEDDKNEYYLGGEIKEGMMFQVLIIYNFEKENDSIRKAKL
ncbi:UNKNOWN [Stylonychia lemnae]|uniref:N-acetyltransferase domain-containing protein n=1 Tax=Stylonychia lemnae TaxID=5949 RepID=A0A078AB29_STYLE|nr:UNKNOWN [Stylonychia lemnae]|eukprot:CDW77993.1 UNKNOWN [Stylonychia lemnae]